VKKLVENKHLSEQRSNVRLLNLNQKKMIDETPVATPEEEAKEEAPAPVEASTEEKEE